MKKFKKVIAFCLALTLVLSSAGSVFAFTLDGTNYDGIQIKDTFYQLGYITGNEGTFADIFGPANPSDVVLDFNSKAAKFSDYLKANPADFDAWASNAANQTPANPAKFVKADGTVVTVPPVVVEPELDVVDIDVLNKTTIQVEFNDGVTKTFPVSLKTGSNSVTFTYNGVTFTKTVTYNPSQVSVSNVEFVNYRNVRVTFDGLVDEASATDAANYYFEIVDGNAAYGFLPDFPTLQYSNQLSMIETEYIYGADGWWTGKNADGDKVAPAHIVADTVNGKTVVDIFLPEDARFTTLEDKHMGSYPDPYFAADAERTLAVELRESTTDGHTTKLLTKDTVVNVAVRNIKDLDEQFTVDTAVMPIRIYDNVDPELLRVDVVENNRHYCHETIGLSNLPRALGSFDLLRTKGSIDQVGEAIQLTYSEPVFDAHRNIDMSDLDYYRDIALYVNGKEVASLAAGNLKEFMKFEMGKDGTYDESRIVTIDAEKAVWAAYNEEVATGKSYIIRFVGISDLAGNVEVSAEHSFTVKFYDNAVVNPNPVTPEVIGVAQVADNIFRIEFNREDVKGTFVIEDSDGEGFGDLETEIPRSAESANGHFYSYVAVPAMDHEPDEAIPTGEDQNECLLAYDGMDEIYRNIRVKDIYVKDRYDEIADYTLHGNDYVPNAPMTMVDDILAPVAVEKDVVYGEAKDALLVIPVEDVTPWVDDENAEYWASPIAYTYFDEKFGNEILADQEDAHTYLPILVSYEDARGAIHQEVVTNYDVKPDNSSLNKGYPGSISFIDGELVLDLHNYTGLLRNGSLIPGETYKVEIPKGYFTDSPKDTNFWNNEADFEFDDYELDMLYVDDARDDDNYAWIRRGCHGRYDIVDSGLGYTSDAQALYIDVEAAPAPEPEEEAVPQTSKQLIFFDEATNTLRIEFTGTIDVATLKNPENYSLDGKTIAQWDKALGTDTEIKYVVDGDHQYAVFEIPQDSIQEEGDYELIVSGVAHPDGGMMTPVEATVRLVDNYRPEVIEAVVTGDSQILLTFNEPIRYFIDTEETDAHAVANNFIVMVDGNRWYVDTAVLPDGEDNDREIVLNGTKLPETGDITVEIAEDQNDNILVIDFSPLKNPMRMDTYDVERP